MKKIILAMIALPFLFACASRPNLTADQAFEKRFEGEPGDGKFPVIDAHTHTHFSGLPERTSQIPDTKEQFLKEMKETGVVGAVVHLDRKLKDYQDLTQFNVITCAGIDKGVDLKHIEAGLAQKKYRCIKIYLGYVHEWAYSKTYEPVYKLAEKYQVPVVFHTGDTYSDVAKLKYADPMTIDEVAVDHPKVKFVIAHCGNPWIETAAEVAYKNPNVYLEASAFMIGDLSKYDDETLNTYIVAPIKKIFGYVGDPTKLMFGTDWPLTGMKGYMQVMKKAIPREHWRKVFHDNAVSVFGFPSLPNEKK